MEHSHVLLTSKSTKQSHDYNMNSSHDYNYLYIAIATTKSSISDISDTVVIVYRG